MGRLQILNSGWIVIFLTTDYQTLLRKKVQYVSMYKITKDFSYIKKKSDPTKSLNSGILSFCIHLDANSSVLQFDLISHSNIGYMAKPQGSSSTTNLSSDIVTYLFVI